MNAHFGLRGAETGAKPTTNKYPSIDVRKLERAGALQSGFQGGISWSSAGMSLGSMQLRAFHDRIQVSFWSRDQSGTERERHRDVAIVRTPCHIGGSRAWFVCPAPRCRRRVAILYVSHEVACRICHRLAYASTREDAEGRARLRVERIRKRLGWRPGFLNGLGPRPKRMRWWTYSRLLEQHMAACEVLARYLLRAS